MQCIAAGDNALPLSKVAITSEVEANLTQLRCAHLTREVEPMLSSDRAPGILTPCFLHVAILRQWQMPMSKRIATGTTHNHLLKKAQSALDRSKTLLFIPTHHLFSKKAQL